MRPIVVVVAILAMACSDLDGLSSSNADGGTGAAGGGLTLRTQAFESRQAMPAGALELTVPGGVQDGDLLYYVIVNRGTRSVYSPPGLTEVSSTDDSCAPVSATIFTRAGAASLSPTQKFQFRASVQDLEATVLVLTAVEPGARSHTAKVVSNIGEPFVADPIIAGSADVPGHILLAYVSSPATAVPDGTTALAKSGRTNFFALAVTNPGQVTLPALSGASKCGVAAATLFKDR